MEENLNNIKKASLNKTWLLVTGLVILTVILLVVSLTSKNFPGLPSKSENTQTNFAHTTLAISEEPRTSSVSGTYEADVTINSEDNNISGAQLEISYDPKIITKVDIKLGSFLTDPAVLLKKIDTASGRITYVLGIKAGGQAVKGTGTIAVISFSKTSTEESTISFLPHTQVSAPGYNQSVLRETVSAVIGVIPSSSNAQNFVTPQKTQGPSQ